MTVGASVRVDGWFLNQISLLTLQDNQIYHTEYLPVQNIYPYILAPSLEPDYSAFPVINRKSGTRLERVD